MRTYSRPLLLVLGAAAFAALAPFFPSLISGTVVKYMAGVFVLVGTMLSVFFAQLGNTTGVGVLSSREMERYTAKRIEIRGRFWLVIGLCLACSVVMWLLSEKHVSRIAAVNGAVVGFFVFVGVTYLLVVARWINDLSAFADRMRLIEQQRKEHEALLKRLADAAKNHSA
ncbi:MULTISPECIES: hypothetical protein [unclassified Paraburkholderia]|uniref:hypothetical protein n=1 Tax=unclassified Paraburkholderia TaxID=2615204 RepID=UPI0020B8A465|nr:MULTISPECIES: hypothetical protein [unclassified Paraburkholderia]MCP3720541.1 hypothetical protein [Paraburkholderia sp. CNPSo 3281]